MKRGFIVGSIVALVLVLMIVGYWGKFSATGNVAKQELDSTGAVRVIDGETGSSSILVKGLINSSCTDTDGGLNYSVAGMTYGYNSNGSAFYQNDTCVNSNTLREWFCWYNIPNQTTYNCPYGCSNGACLNEPQNQTNCTDSDWGLNYSIKGTVTNSSGTFTDFCYNSILVGEYSCEVIGAPPYSCANLGTNYVCSNGACISNQTNATCTDIDGGINPSVYGTINGITTSGGNFSFSDFCHNAYSLIEYYCSGYSPRNQLLECAVGEVCSNGACVVSNQTNTNCTDTDGGINLLVKGTACQGSDCNTDYCDDSNHVLEADCGYENGVFGSSHPYLGGSLQTCPLGYSCSDGACVAPSNQTTKTCNDTDGGLSYYVKGSVLACVYTPFGGSCVATVDTCTSNQTGSILTENYCSGTSPSSKLVSCVYGCANDGACKRKVTRWTKFKEVISSVLGRTETRET